MFKLMAGLESNEIEICGEAAIETVHTFLSKINRLYLDKFKQSLEIIQQPLCQEYTFNIKAPPEIDIGRSLVRFDKTLEANVSLTLPLLPHTLYPDVSLSIIFRRKSYDRRTKKFKNDVSPFLAQFSTYHWMNNKIQQKDIDSIWEKIPEGDRYPNHPYFSVYYESVATAGITQFLEELIKAIYNDFERWRDNQPTV